MTCLLVPLLPPPHIPPHSRRSRRRSSAATSPPTTSSSSPAPETRRPPSTKSSTELRLAGVKIKKEVNKHRAKWPGVEAGASSCTNDCTERRWLRKQRTRGSYFVLLFTFRKGMTERSEAGGGGEGRGGEGAGCKVTCLDINKLWF